MHKIILIFALSLFVSFPAYAHKVVASAWTDGNDIEGEVGMSNGEMAPNGTIVIVADADGNKLGETTITEDGLFRFTPTKAIAHHFSANLGAGHVANVVVSVSELPEHLNTASSPEEMPKQTNNTSSTTAIDTDAIAKIVAKAVRKEVQPLRKEIAAYKEKNDMQSILGGIGYIFGLTGIVFYIAARRKESNKA